MIYQKWCGRLRGAGIRFKGATDALEKIYGTLVDKAMEPVMYLLGQVEDIELLDFAPFDRS